LSFISLCGFPFLSGFFSKDLIIDYFFLREINLFFLITFLSSIFFSVLYRIKLIYFGLINLRVRFSTSFTYLSSLKNYLIGLLFLWSIFLGKFLFGFIVDGEYFIFSFLQKFLGVILFFSGIFL